MPNIFRQYKTYSFVDKDPIIDILRTAIQQDGRQFKEISEASGVSAGTLSNWFYGETKRPTHACVMAVARALGYDYRLTKVSQITLAVNNGGHTAKRRRRT